MQTIAVNQYYSEALPWGDAALCKGDIVLQAGHTNFTVSTEVLLNLISQRSYSE